MSRDGTGTYNLPSGQPVVTGTVISSTTHNTLASDLATALTDSLAKDGQTTVTGAISFNGQELFLDVDKDTSLTADTDDQIDVKIAGSDDFRFTANTLTALSGSSFKESNGGIHSRVLLQTVTASSQAAVDLGEGGEITSTYHKYAIELLNVIPATDGVELHVRTSSDTGTSYDSGASDYEWSAFYGASSEGDTADSQIQAIPGTNQIGSDTNELGVSGTIHLVRPSESTFTSLWGDGMYYPSGATPPQHFRFASQRSEAGVVNAIRILFSSGNVESGIIKLYGVK